MSSNAPSYPIMFDDGQVLSTSLTHYRPMVVGDLHVSDKPSNRHRNYLESCINFLNDITQRIRDENITHLFLLGDLVGRTTEKNFQERETMLYFVKVLQVWNSLTNNNVFAVKGNHDMGKSLTDFELFEGMGLIKTPSTYDLGCVRFHLISYGDHNRKIELREDGYNIALMHTQLMVDGKTTWLTRAADEVDLTSLHNLEGVSLILAGHIHEPSPRPITTSIRGTEVTLFYPGCGTRPKYERNVWEKVCAFILPITDESLDISQTEFQLEPADTFYSKTLSDEDIEELADADNDLDKPTFNLDELVSILKELKDYNIMGEADYKTHLIRMGGLDKEATDLALKYIEEAEGVFLK